MIGIGIGIGIGIEAHQSELAQLQELARLSDESTSLRLRDPEMHSAQKGNPWQFGMRARIGVDADSDLVHTVRGTSTNVNDVVEGNGLLDGEEGKRLRGCCGLPGGLQASRCQCERTVAHCHACGPRRGTRFA